MSYQNTRLCRFCCIGGSLVLARPILLPVDPLWVDPIVTLIETSYLAIKESS